MTVENSPPVDFDKTYDVAIIGGGPVGFALAIELGLRGISVAVIEKYPTLHNVPKGQNLTQRSVEHFHFWGIELQLRAARTVPADFPIGGLSAYGTLVSDYTNDFLQRGLVAPFYYCKNERLPQYQTEQVLRDRAAEITGIDVAYGWAGEGVSQDQTTATAHLRRRDGDTQTLTARYLVGADGSHSAIREAAKIPQTKSDHDRLMVLLVFKSVGLHDHLARYPDKQFYCVLNPDYQGYWQFFGRVDLGSTWFFHAPVPMGTTKDNFDFKAYLQQAAGVEFEVEFQHIGLWDLRIALADSYQKGRIFLAGDAAHSHPPYGGYGINTGFEDARNLGWKLAVDLQGWGGAGILASYDKERRSVFASTARDFIEKFIHEDRDFLNAHNPARDLADFETAWQERGENAPEVTAFAPNYDGSPIVFGRPGATPGAISDHQMQARAGHHLAPTKLAIGQNSYEYLGPDFTLFALDAAREQIAAFKASADALALPLTIVGDENSPARAIYGARLILVRPDQYVAWAGDQTDDAQAILSRAIGHT
jgi:4-hydroxyisophthalate hydroxylase